MEIDFVARLMIIAAKLRVQAKKLSWLIGSTSRKLQNVGLRSNSQRLIKLKLTIKKQTYPNPLTPKISFVILLTVCRTILLYYISQKNLVSNQLVIPQLRFLFILITCLYDIVQIQLGEILFWSHTGVKGLKLFLRKVLLDRKSNVFFSSHSERCRHTLRGHADSVNSIVFLPYSNTLLTCSADKTLSLWDARTVRKTLCLYLFMNK